MPSRKPFPQPDDPKPRKRYKPSPIVPRKPKPRKPNQPKIGGTGSGGKLTLPKDMPKGVVPRPAPRRPKPNGGSSITPSRPVPMPNRKPRPKGDGPVGMPAPRRPRPNGGGGKAVPMPMPRMPRRPKPKKLGPNKTNKTPRRIYL